MKLNLTYHLRVCAICFCFFSSIINEYDSFRRPPANIENKKKLIGKISLSDTKKLGSAVAVFKNIKKT